MYKHVVFWKIKEEVEGTKKADLIRSAIEKLNALPAVIPEIKQYEVAQNICNYGASFYNICLISVFESKETFWSYTKYPEHDAVVAFFAACLLGTKGAITLSFAQALVYMGSMTWLSGLVIRVQDSLSYCIPRGISEMI